MSTAKMAEMLENTEDWDPITPQLIQSIFKNDSRAMESLGKRWNIEPLEQEARYNQQNPEEGIANASKATAGGFLGSWIGGLAGGNTGYVDQIGNAYEGAMAGQSTTGGLLGSGYNLTPAQRRMMMNQGMGLMQEQPQTPPPPPPPRPYEPSPMINPYMTEEEKRRLMMMQMGIYQ